MPRPIASRCPAAVRTLAAAFVALAWSTAAGAQSLPIGMNSVPPQYRTYVPPPVGITVAYASTIENLTLSDVSVSIAGTPLPAELLNLTGLKQNSKVVTAVVDVWLFPFLDVYGIGGRISGHASDIQATVPPIALPPALAGIASSLASLTVDYSGNVFGGGATVAQGIGHVFGSYDINATSTGVGQVDNRVTTVLQTIRGGVTLGSAEHRLVFYAGAQHEAIYGAQRGSVTLAGVPITYDLMARPEHAWNAVFGGNVGLTRNWIVNLEGGASGRQAFVAALSYRF